MTTEQINIACAELDGATSPFCECGCNCFKIGEQWKRGDYTNSYDAIIPLIQRQSEEVQHMIYATLVEMTNDSFAIRSTPLQLATALLRATNKYNEK